MSFLSLTFSTLSALSIPCAIHSARTCSSSYYTSNLKIWRSNPSITWITLTYFWHLWLLPYFNQIMNLHKVVEYLSLTIFTAINGNEPKVLSISSESVVALLFNSFWVCYNYCVISNWTVAILLELHGIFYVWCQIWQEIHEIYVINAQSD